MEDDIKFPPTWGVNTPENYGGPGHPLDEGLDTLVRPGQIVELRVIGAHYLTEKKTLSGFFDDLSALREAAHERAWNLARSVCITLNPVRRDAPHDVDNRVGLALWGGCTADADIARIQTILLDFDPERPRGVCATDTEHRGALDRGRAVARWLHERGVYASLADSGNGAHVYIHVDLPADTDTEGLIDRVMTAVSFGFDDADVALDPDTGNPSRVAKLPGTMNRKGDDLPARPHRRSEMLEMALRGHVTSMQALEEVASFLPEVA